MPTGYTAELCDKDVSFEKFVLTCARAFGALVEMREDPLDKPIPQRLKPSDYHEKELKKAMTELVRLEALSASDAQAEADQEYREAVEYHENHVAKVSACLERLTSMRSKVADWKPPTTEHEGLKKFMIEQLNETIRFDGTVCLEPPKKKPGKEWLQEKIASLARTVVYHTKENQEEVDRTESRNQWIEQLRESLKE